MSTEQKQDLVVVRHTAFLTDAKFVNLVINDNKEYGYKLVNTGDPFPMNESGTRFKIDMIATRTKSENDALCGKLFREIGESLKELYRINKCFNPMHYQALLSGNDFSSFQRRVACLFSLLHVIKYFTTPNIPSMKIRPKILFDTKAKVFELIRSFVASEYYHSKFDLQGMFDKIVPVYSVSWDKLNLSESVIDDMSSIQTVGIIDSYISRNIIPLCTLADNIRDNETRLIHEIDDKGRKLEDIIVNENWIDKACDEVFMVQNSLEFCNALDFKMYHKIAYVLLKLCSNIERKGE